MPLSGIESWEARQGFLGATAGYALAARRHMALYGTTQEQLGAYAIACRQWAALNPQAFLRKPITLQDYLASPYVLSRFACSTAAFRSTERSRSWSLRQIARPMRPSPPPTFMAWGKVTVAARACAATSPKC